MQLLTWSRFLLAKFFLSSLADKITIADVREAIAQLPTHLPGTREDQRLIILDQEYDSAWMRINQQKEGFRNIAKRVLAWIVFAKRPLSTEELQHALAVKLGKDELDEDAIPQVHDMVSFCAGLVTTYIHEESNVIGLVHYTTQEYFERKKDDYFPDAEAMIARTCISYLSFKTFGEYRLGLRNHSYPYPYVFYKYASEYWVDHARLVGSQLDKTILRFLMNGAKASNAFYAALESFRFHLGPDCWYYLQEEHDPLAHTPMSGMHLAVLFAFDEAINLLLENGCPINENKEVVVTPLFLAIDQGNLHIAQILLDHGDHISFKKKHGGKALDIAMQPNRYNRKFIKKLIATGIASGEDISWFFQPAIKYGHSAIVELLLRSGADIDTGVGEGRGYGPLHNAVYYGNEALVRFLLDKGANVKEASNRDSDTPLHVAARKERLTVIELLLETGASIEASNSRGETPLHMAAKAADAATINLLLKKGANIEAQDKNGRTPVFIAVCCKGKAAAGALLKKGANIEAVDYEGYTPLLLAAEASTNSILDLLMEMGANVDVATWRQNTTASRSPQFPYARH